MTTRLATILATIDGWGADHAAAAVVGPDGVIAMHGPLDHPFRWASVTKLMTALGVLRASEDGRIDLDEPAGPPGASVRHLLAHASGLPFDGMTTLAKPGARRIYSNTGYDILGAMLADRRGVVTPETALARSVIDPLRMDGATLLDRPSQGIHGSIADLAALARELLRPTLIGPGTYAAMIATAFPGLKGVLPGVGPFDPLDWGLGPELRATKRPHWTGTRNSPGTFGHFGGTGTFLWVDPAIDRALACLTDRPYDSWALDAWPTMSDAVIETFVA